MNKHKIAERLGFDFDGSVRGAVNLLNLALAIHDTRLIVDVDIDKEVIDLVVEAKENLVQAASLMLANESLEIVDD